MMHRPPKHTETRLRKHESCDGGESYAHLECAAAERFIPREADVIDRPHASAAAVRTHRHITIFGTGKMPKSCEGGCELTDRPDYGNLRYRRQSIPSFRIL